MARIRSVKPELRESKIVGSWPMEVRYFWVLFWGYLDDHGRGLDLPKRIAGDCFPLDTDNYEAKDIDTWLDLMTKGVDNKPGPVCRYEADGKRCVHAVNWHDHQKPNRPSRSHVPPCPIHEGLTEALSEGVSEDLKDSHGPDWDAKNPKPWERSTKAQANALTEPLTEGADGDSLPGAGEQGSRGAGEQQQRAHESRSEYPDNLRKIVTDATGATDSEATEILTRIRRERRPRNLLPFVRRMAEDGDLGEWLAEIRGEAQKIDVAAQVRRLRDGPPCEHGTPGGAAPHPVSGEPLCPLCRRKPPLRVVDQEAS